MTQQQAQELMRAAWAARRASLDADPAERAVQIARVKSDLGRAVDLCRAAGPPVQLAADLTLADRGTRPGDVVPARVLRDGGGQVLFVTVTDTAPGHLHFDGRPIVKQGK